ncbi:MAG: hypothetical protein RL077_1102 [Verrucomicrobiota bacterium]|jgi:hypothetical protein
MGGDMAFFIRVSDGEDVRRCRVLRWGFFYFGCSRVGSRREITGGAEGVTGSRFGANGGRWRAWTLRGRFGTRAAGLLKVPLRFFRDLKILKKQVIAGMNQSSLVPP